MQLLRADCRVDANMAEVVGFSLISPKVNRVLGKRAHSSSANGANSDPGNGYSKRIKF